MTPAGYIVRKWDVLEIVGGDDLPHGHFRVVHALVAKNVLFLFKLNTDDLMSPPASGVPVRIPYSSVLAGLKAGQINSVEIALPFVMTMPEASIPKSAKGTRDASWELIEPLVSKSQYPALVSDAEMRQKAITERADALEMQPRALRRLLARFWHFGGKRGLLGLQDRCGAPGQIRRAGRVKRGRPKTTVATGHDIELIGVNAKPEDIRLIEDVSRTKIIRAGWTIQRAYEHLKDDLLVDVEIGRDGQIIKRPRPVNLIISSGQFYYYYARFRRQLDVQHALAGKHWDLKLRALKSSARHGIYGPTDRFEIDATVANVWLVSKFDRTKLIGRPVVYLICDTWSRYIVGVHVALEGPSWDTARLAICNALTNKSAFLAAIGMSDRIDEWDTPDCCHELVSDQGEILSRKAEIALQDGLGIDSAIAAMARGDMKAVTERRFGTLDTRLSWIAGAYRKRALEALEAPGDQRWNARLDIIQFLRILVEEILYHNNEEEYFDLRTPEMVATTPDFRPTPRNMYFWGREHLVGLSERMLPAHRDPFDVYRALLPSKDCPITRQGFQFSTGRFYSSPRLDATAYFAKSVRSRSKPKQRLYFDPVCPETMFFANLEEKRWEEVGLRHADRSRFGGLTDYDIRDMLAIEVLQRNDGAESKNNKRRGKTKRQQSIVDDAERQYQEAPKTTSRTGQKKQQKVNRKLEAEGERVRNQGIYGGRSTESRPVPVEKAAGPRAHVIDMMSRLRKK